MKLLIVKILIFLFGSTAFAQTFQDNLSKEPMGDFPSQWDVVKGMAITDQVDGYKMISIMHDGIIKPIVNGQTKNYLGNDFTIEFDAFFDKSPGEGLRLEVRLWDGHVYSNGAISYSPFTLYKHGIKTYWSTPEPGNSTTFLKELQTEDAAWRHVTFECKNEQLKVLLDGKLILTFPKFKMQPTMVSIGGMINSSFDAKVGFTNFTVVSAPAETKIAMIVDTETNKVLDINTLSNLKNIPDLKVIYPKTKTYFGIIYGNYAVRPHEYSDIKKPHFIDLNTYGNYSLLPEKQAQMVFDFEKELLIENLKIEGSQQQFPMQDGTTILGNYFENKNILQTPTKNLVIKDRHLFLLPKDETPLTEVPTLIGETEKNETETETSQYPNISAPVLGTTNPNLGESILSSSLNNVDDACGALPTEEQYQVLLDPNSLYNKRLKFIESYTNQDLRSVPSVQYINGQFVMPQQLRFTTTPTENYKVIPIVAHILGQTDHRRPLSLTQLYLSISRSNKIFEKYGVYLQLDKILFIDDDQLINKTFTYGEDKNEDGEMDYIVDLDIQNRDIKGKLNIYFVPKAEALYKGYYYTASWSNFPNKNAKRQHIIMRNDQTMDETTLTHEIGHWFNLLHTHETFYNNNLNFQTCHVTGDLCCDTPADPGLKNKVSDDCEYKNKSDSKLSGLLDPDPKNLMSYSLPKCRDKFSDNQIKRLYNAYLGMEEDRGYTFEVNKEIGENLGQFNIEPGWDFIEHFESAGSTFMLLFNPNNGIVRIHKINQNGFLVKRKIYSIQYQEGWSAINLTKIGTTNYIVMVKYSTGNIAISKINTDGTLGPKRLYKTNKSWTASGIKTVGNPYLLLVNKYENLSAVYQINSDGSLGTKTDEVEFDYEIIEMINEYFLCYNSINGNIHRAKIKEDGKLIFDGGVGSTIDTDLSSIRYFTSFDNYFQESFYNTLTLNKNNGSINLYTSFSFSQPYFNSSKINANLALGYNTVTPYDVFDGNRYQNYVMVSNSTTGDAILYNLNNNM